MLRNLTAMKDFHGWSAGPVGYWRVQTTADETDGDHCGGMTEGKAEQTALGLGLTHRFGAVKANYVEPVDPQKLVYGALGK